MHALGAAIGFGTANKTDTLMRFHEIICNQYYRIFLDYGVLRFQSEKEKYVN